MSRGEVIYMAIQLLQLIMLAKIGGQVEEVRALIQTYRRVLWDEKELR